MTAAGPDARHQQPWLHDLLVTVAGPTTAVSTDVGDLVASDHPGTGLYVDDRRVVSELALRLDDLAPVAIAASALGERSQHWSAARHLGDSGADATVHVRRTRVVTDAELDETVVVMSRAGGPVSTRLTIDLAGDGAEIASVKTGAAAAPPLPATSDPVGWADERHHTSFDLRPPPSNLERRPAGGLRAVWPLKLAAGTSATVTIRAEVRRVTTTDFDATAGSGAADWDPDELADGVSDARLAQLVRVSFTDLRQLLLRDPESPDDVVAAAGSPWYLTLFGRDSLWTARFMVRHSPALVLGTLRALARRQATETDPETAAEPGKILHELRRTQAAAEGNHLPPRYYGTVDATALWILLLADAVDAGLAPTEVDALRPHLDAALGWLAAAVARSPDGFVRYVDESTRGLSNQGWKDSGDAMRRADGSVAPAPIALLEAQGYAVAAGRAAAGLIGAYGATRSGSATHWEGWADELAARVRARFWVGGDDPYLAMALDGEGRPVDGVGSNMGHVLATGMLTDRECDLVVGRLLRPDLLRRFGIATLSADNPGYNPIGYHTGSVWAHDTAITVAGMVAIGRRDEARRVAGRLLDLAAAFDGRLPELCGGDPVGDRPVPYPASCRPQAWAAASAAVVLDALAGD